MNMNNHLTLFDNSFYIILKSCVVLAKMTKHGYNKKKLDHYIQIMLTTR